MRRLKTWKWANWLTPLTQYASKTPGFFNNGHFFMDGDLVAQWVSEQEDHNTNSWKSVSERFELLLKYSEMGKWNMEMVAWRGIVDDERFPDMVETAKKRIDTADKLFQRKHQDRNDPLACSVICQQLLADKFPNMNNLIVHLSVSRLLACMAYRFAVANPDSTVFLVVEKAKLGVFYEFPTNVWILDPKTEFLTQCEGGSPPEEDLETYHYENYEALKNDSDVMAGYRALDDNFLPAHMVANNWIHKERSEMFMPIPVEPWESEYGYIAGREWRGLAYEVITEKLGGYNDYFTEYGRQDDTLKGIKIPMCDETRRQAGFHDRATLERHIGNWRDSNDVYSFIVNEYYRHTRDLPRGYHFTLHPAEMGRIQKKFLQNMGKHSKKSEAVESEEQVVVDGRRAMNKIQSSIWSLRLLQTAGYKVPLNFDIYNLDGNLYQNMLDRHRASMKDRRSKEKIERVMEYDDPRVQQQEYTRARVKYEESIKTRAKEKRLAEKERRRVVNAERWNGREPGSTKRTLAVDIPRKGSVPAREGPVTVIQAGADSDDFLAAEPAFLPDSDDWYKEYMDEGYEERKESYEERKESREKEKVEQPVEKPKVEKPAKVKQPPVKFVEQQHGTDSYIELLDDTDVNVEEPSVTDVNVEQEHVQDFVEEPSVQDFVEQPLVQDFVEESREDVLSTAEEIQDSAVKPPVEDTKEAVEEPIIIEDTAKPIIIEDTAVFTKPLVEDTVAKPVVDTVTEPLVEDTVFTTRPDEDTVVSTKPREKDTVTKPREEDTAIKPIIIEDTVVSTKPVVEDTVVSTKPHDEDTVTKPLVEDSVFTTKPDEYTPLSNGKPDPNFYPRDPNYRLTPGKNKRQNKRRAARYALLDAAAAEAKEKERVEESSVKETTQEERKDVTKESKEERKEEIKEERKEDRRDSKTRKDRRDTKTQQYRKEAQRGTKTQAKTQESPQRAPKDTQDKPHRDHRKDTRAQAGEKWDARRETKPQNVKRLNNQRDVREDDTEDGEWGHQKGRAGSVLAPEDPREYQLKNAPNEIMFSNEPLPEPPRYFYKGGGDFGFSTKKKPPKEVLNAIHKRLQAEAKVRKKERLAAGKRERRARKKERAKWWAAKQSIEARNMNEARKAKKLRDQGLEYTPL